MRIHVPSRGRSSRVDAVQRMFDGFRTAWLVDSEREADLYATAGAVDVSVTGADRFGKAAAINSVLRDSSLEGEWAVFSDDSHGGFEIYSDKWEDADAATALSRLLSGISLAQNSEASLVGINSVRDVQLNSGRSDHVPEYAYDLSPHYVVGRLFAARCGVFSIPETYDDELVASLESIWASGRTVSCLTLGVKRIDLTEGGHGQQDLRDREHTDRIVAERYGPLVRTPRRCMGGSRGWSYPQLERDGAKVDSWRADNPYRHPE